MLDSISANLKEQKMLFSPQTFAKKVRTLGKPDSNAVDGPLWFGTHNKTIRLQSIQKSQKALSSLTVVFRSSL